MSQDALLNIESKEIRYAHLKNGSLHNLMIERKSSKQLTGNVYRGEVTNILANIQSAFINIGEGDNGFIHISDILENTQKFQEMFDMDFEMSNKKMQKKSESDITKMFKAGQPVLVQVVKEPIGNKGARLTSNLSIAGRYLVLLPNTPHRGVSRKIEARDVRDKLKKLIRAFELPQEMGLICRTASVNATPEALIAEANELLKTWEGIVENFEKTSKPTCLFQESDLIKRAVITAVDKKFDRLLIDDYKVFQRAKNIYSHYKTEHNLKVEYYRDSTPMFDRFNIEREIDKALSRKVYLSSGGYLFFDKTEAMYTIDVNSGRSTQKSVAKNVEEALVQINMNAAVEIARQLRLRNVGGLIICDFIDMRSRKNQRRVLDHLKEAMKEDSAKCTILSMSEFGLVEMTRQRSRESLAQVMLTPCPYCNGSGHIRNPESTIIELERMIKKLISCQKQYGIEVHTHPELTQFLGEKELSHLEKTAEDLNAQVRFKTDDNLHLNQVRFYSLISGDKIDV